MFSRKIPLVSSALLLLLLVTSCNNKTEEKPNILWITIEDTSPHFLANYGNKIETTPVMDQLGKKGVIFTNAYATGAVCSSSRSTIITGCSTEELGTGNHRSNYKTPDFIKGFPYYLKKEGYYTTNNDKTDYNLKDEEAFIAEAWNENSKKAGWWNRKEGQPFFSVFNYNSCHQSRTMTFPYALYENEILNRLPEYYHIAPDSIEMPPFYRDSKEMRKQVARVYNGLRKTDLEVQLLMDRLEQEGLKENTIIFIYADHGQGMPRGKCTSIGFGHRVPFYVWFPKKYKHLSPWGVQEVTEELISFEDLAPTILSLTGTEIPEHMKGRPILGTERKEPVSYIFGSRNRLDDTPGLERTVFDGRFVYSRNFYPHLPIQRYQKYADVSAIVKTIRKDAAAGLLNDVQLDLVKQPRAVEYLFDLKNDKWELTNLAENPEYKSDIQRLRKVMKERAIQIKDIHFLPEELMLKRSENSTAYEARLQNENLPIEDILEVADMVGLETNPQAFLPYLKDKREEIRYWAAVGLNFIGKTKGLEESLSQSLTDASLYVQAEIATLLYKTQGNSKAKDVLSKLISGTNKYVAHHTMQQVLYIPEIASDFKVDFQQVKNRYGQKRLPGFDYNVQNSAEMFFYLFDNQPLYYSSYEKWIDDMNTTTKSW
ncbi:sulfatase [Polaribacter sp. BAL334]|uniref:sulfatase family protein n=1 Tax=Polaribacter sp. BAL334 TaxID=1708178 RepID=UPI0018D1FD83|nr:sulfatase [Polaribacter sp. BAL334]MBG7612136.1 sulfatase [Polaribacter sp. BAL334]